MIQGTPGGSRKECLRKKDCLRSFLDALNGPGLNIPGVRSRGEDESGIVGLRLAKEVRSGRLSANRSENGLGRGLPN